MGASTPVALGISHAQEKFIVLASEGIPELPDGSVAPDSTPSIMHCFERDSLADAFELAIAWDKRAGCNGSVAVYLLAKGQATLLYREANDHWVHTWDGPEAPGRYEVRYDLGESPIYHLVGEARPNWHPEMRRAPDIHCTLYKTTKKGRPKSTLLSLDI